MTERRPDLNTDPNTDAIAAYLDGELSDRAAAELRDRAHDDPSLAAELRAGEAVDEGLRRLFTVQDGETPDAVLAAASSAEPPAHRGPWRRGVLAIAAALVLAATAWAATVWVQRPPITAGEPMYASIIEDFLPYAKCNTPESFADYAALAFGKAATLTPPGPGVELLGWRLPRGTSDPEGTLSDRSRIMIAYVEGDPVVVVMDIDDRKAARVRTEPGSGVSTFERTIDGFVLYELSPRDEPGVVNLIEP